MRDKETVRAELNAAENEMDRLGDIVDNADIDERSAARVAYDVAVRRWLDLQHEFVAILGGPGQKR
jgi:hypothetical protein